MLAMLPASTLCRACEKLTTCSSTGIDVPWNMVPLSMDFPQFDSRRTLHVVRPSARTFHSAAFRPWWRGDGLKPALQTPVGRNSQQIRRAAVVVSSGQGLAAVLVEDVMYDRPAEHRGPFVALGQRCLWALELVR